ncbi:hypothetical protein [Nitrospirillum viridazoti]|uniref:Uncharacterized protein n=1 Tax=Nitrospirillum amazonense TaxID=28077 RepID=A0A560HNT3_9PROT|nr:hypothetical protein [Nitrospirillum amazonense]TWB48218.1 hypothetical protein FBZ92_1302 [Nitrospirillum amazonense]
MPYVTTSQPATDCYPALIADVRAEFGDEGLMANVERFATAEEPDFLWEGRIEEHYLGEWLNEDEHADSLHCILILSHFRGQFVVASVVVDGDERPQFATMQRPYDNREAADQAFHAIAHR